MNTESPVSIPTPITPLVPHASPGLRQPTYRQHKPTGRALVVLNGQAIYLGKWNSKESKAAYKRALAEWYARGCQPAPHADTFTIFQLVDGYLTFAESHYRGPDGKVTTEMAALRYVAGPLLRLYGKMPAAEFNPLHLMAVRDEMIAMGWVRKSINKQAIRIRRIFKWGVSRTLLPASVYQALTTLEPLKLGRSKAKESAPVREVPEAAVRAVLPLVSAQVAAMIRLQLLTGMRPGEACAMRTADVVTPAEGPWVYSPLTHKNAYREHERKIAIGPKAREILAPWLRAPAERERFIFSPEEAEAARLVTVKAARQSRRTPSQEKRLRRAAQRNLRGWRGRAPGDRYDVPSYRRAIWRACDQAFPLPAELEAAHRDVRTWINARTYADGKAPALQDMPEELRQKREAAETWRSAHRWHPHQLRHAAATAIEDLMDLESARVVLGHRTIDVTQRYAHADQRKAARIIEEVG